MAEIPGAHTDVGLGRERLPRRYLLAQLLGDPILGGGEDLHQAPLGDVPKGPRIEAALLTHDRPNEKRVDVELGGRCCHRRRVRLGIIELPECTGCPGMLLHVSFRNRLGVRDVASQGQRLSHDQVDLRRASGLSSEQKLEAGEVLTANRLQGLGLRQNLLAATGQRRRCG